MKKVILLAAGLISVRASADSTVNRRGINAVDGSICSVQYSVKDKHLTALEFAGNYYDVSSGLQLLRSSFELGRCAISSDAYPIQAAPAGAEFVVPSSCQKAETDSDQMRDYLNDRNVANRAAWTITVDSVNNPSRFQFEEKWLTIKAQFTCLNLK